MPRSSSWQGLKGALPGLGRLQGQYSRYLQEIREGDGEQSVARVREPGRGVAGKGTGMTGRAWLVKREGRMMAIGNSHRGQQPYACQHRGIEVDIDLAPHPWSVFATLLRCR